jgi:DNA-binding MarR family transcriptional regulator
MDQVKEAFSKVKSDMDSIREELNSLRYNISEIKESMIDLAEIFKEFKNQEDQKKTKNELLNQQNIPKYPQIPQQTNRHITPTHPTHPSTHKYLPKPLKPQNIGISIGNQGVPTDKQTDKQTHQQTHKSSHNQEKYTIDNAVEILESLDNIKKEIRLKFKRLTDQEMIVFSTLYQLEEENGYTDYKTISERINLSESSIRDYIGRLIKKGIPVEKTKINNKSIQLNISKNLKKIASLHTILQLREL